MKTKLIQIQEMIEKAKAMEKSTGDLRAYLGTRMPSLHKSITFNRKNPSQSLLDFTTRYIEHVPEFLKAMNEISTGANILSVTEPFLAMAEEYFIKENNVEEFGLQALINPAYLANRLIEEVSDRVFVIAGVPLSPMDMNISNIVAHAIIGEEFANELDFGVYYSVESLFNPEQFNDSDAFNQFALDKKREGWKDDIDKWPCLAGDSAISLELFSADNEQLVH